MSIRLTSKKTLPILLKALQSPQFSQTNLAKETNTSIGRVNKIISWLQEKELATKEKGKYLITAPNRLTDIIATQQTINKKRTFQVQISKEELKKLRKNVTFCLESAYDQETENIQIIHSEDTEQLLSTLPRGTTKITTFEYENVPETKKQTTSEIQTIIDLKSCNKGALIEEQAAKLWGTRQ